jgi:hypothetical protein
MAMNLDIYKLKKILSPQDYRVIDNGYEIDLPQDIHSLKWTENLRIWLDSNEMKNIEPQVVESFNWIDWLGNNSQYSEENGWEIKEYCFTPFDKHQHYMVLENKKNNQCETIFFSDHFSYIKNEFILVEVEHKGGITSPFSDKEEYEKMHVCLEKYSQQEYFACNVNIYKEDQLKEIVNCSNNPQTIYPHLGKMDKNCFGKINW